MFGLGWQELLLIFFIALLVFGPKKLPEIGKSIGRAMAEFRKSSEEFKEQLEKAVEEEDARNEAAEEGENLSSQKGSQSVESNGEKEEKK